MNKRDQAILDAFEWDCSGLQWYDLYESKLKKILNAMPEESGVIAGMQPASDYAMKETVTCRVCGHKLNYLMFQKDNQIAKRKIEEYIKISSEWIENTGEPSLRGCLDWLDQGGE